MRGKGREKERLKAERGHQMFVYPRTQSRLGDSTQYTKLSALVL